MDKNNPGQPGSRDGKKGGETRRRNPNPYRQDRSNQESNSNKEATHGKERPSGEGNNNRSNNNNRNRNRRPNRNTEGKSKQNNGEANRNKRPETAKQDGNKKTGGRRSAGRGNSRGGRRKQIPTNVPPEMRASLIENDEVQEARMNPWRLLCLAFRAVRAYLRVVNGYLRAPAHDWLQTGGGRG